MRRKEESMKKYTWIVALVMALSLAFIGCDGDPKEPPSNGDGFTSDLTGQSVELRTNQYAPGASESKGLQAQFSGAALMQGNRVNAGDVFTMEITFTLDKALDADLEIGLVDTTVGESEGWWRTLTWDKDDDDDDMYKIPAEELLANTPITKTIVLTAWQGSTGSSGPANALVFESNDLWTKSPVKITFNSFIFKMGDGGEGPPPSVELIPVKITLGTPAIVGDVQVSVDSGGNGFEATGANFNWAIVKFPIDLGTRKMSDVAKVTIDYTGIAGDFNWKTLSLFVADEGGLPTAGGFDAAAFSVADVSTGGVDANEPKELTFDVDKDKVEDFGSKVEIAFHIPADDTAQYKISNITFYFAD